MTPWLLYGLLFYNGDEDENLHVILPVKCFGMISAINVANECWLMALWSQKQLKQQSQAKWPSSGQTLNHRIISTLIKLNVDSFSYKMFLLDQAVVWTEDQYPHATRDSLIGWWKSIKKLHSRIPFCSKFTPPDTSVLRTQTLQKRTPPTCMPLAKCPRYGNRKNSPLSWNLWKQLTIQKTAS